MSQPSSYKIGFQDNEFYYHGFTLRNLPNELFLHFCYPSKVRKYTDLESQEITQRPDHYSWHKDGKGHLKISAEKKMLKGHFPDGSFLPQKQDSFSPLFIISYTKGEEDWEAVKIASTPMPDFHSMGVITPLKIFSLIGFLVPSGMPVEHFKNFDVLYDPERTVLVQMSFFSLFATPIATIRLPIYPSNDVLIVLSDLSDASGKSAFGTSSHLSATFVDLNKAIPKLLDKRIYPDS